MKGIKLFALMLFSINAFAAEQPSKQYIGEIRGQISIDAEGKVTAVDLTNVKQSSLKKFMTEQISKWEFYPMQLNDKPVESTSGLSFDAITFFNESKQLQKIAFQDVVIAPTKLELELEKTKYSEASKQAYKEKRVAPEYPINALYSGTEARLTMAIKIESDGNVSEAGVYKMALLSVASEPNAADRRDAIKMFGENAKRAVQQSRFSSEVLASNNCLNGCVALMTVNYEMQENLWKLYTDIPVKLIPWFENDKVKKIQDKPESQYVRLKSELSEQPIDVGG